jgi:Cu2+-containing amine oxidase
VGCSIRNRPVGAFGTHKDQPCQSLKFLLVNENVESGLGHHPAYQLSYSYSLLSLEDIPVARNPYIDRRIYVTPYDPTQGYAGGEYPVQSKGNDTLHTWTAADRSILNEDIVNWSERPPKAPRAFGGAFVFSSRAGASLVLLQGGR